MQSCNLMCLPENYQMKVGILDSSPAPLALHCKLFARYRTPVIGSSRRVIGSGWCHLGQCVSGCSVWWCTDSQEPKGGC
jgi:hypothetical protein